MLQSQLDIVEELHGQFEVIKKSKTFLIQKHFHKHYELYFLLAGSEIKYFMNDEILNVRQGETVFIKNGYIHKTAYDNQNNFKRILVSFMPEFVGEDYLNLLNELSEKKHFAKSEKISELFTSINEEYNSKRPYYLEQCKNLLRELIITLCRTESCVNAKNLSENEIIIQNAARFILDNLCEEICLQALAEKYAMSQSHFSRTFKQYTGVGVSKYIKLARLSSAEKLLTEGKLSITQVATKCGFNNSNYFISEFKKYKGITPLKYAFLNKEEK